MCGRFLRISIDNNANDGSHDPDGNNGDNDDNDVNDCKYDSNNDDANDDNARHDNSNDDDNGNHDNTDNSDSNDDDNRSRFFSICFYFVFISLCFFRSRGGSVECWNFRSNVVISGRTLKIQKNGNSQKNGTLEK